MKAHKDKIRATFYIDKKLYQLLKRCSQIEGIPMSSIINNEILSERVGKYEFSTPNEWENFEIEKAIEKQEENNDIEKQIEAYEQSPAGILESKKHSISKLLESEQITAEEAAQLIQKAEAGYQNSLQETEILERQQREELHQKWVKAVNDFPLE